MKNHHIKTFKDYQTVQAHMTDDDYLCLINDRDTVIKTGFLMNLLGLSLSEMEELTLEFEAIFPQPFHFNNESFFFKQDAQIFYRYYRKFFERYQIDNLGNGRHDDVVYYFASFLEETGLYQGNPDIFDFI